jgi:hypothetical protein
MLRNHYYMDISETTIAADTMKRGGVRTGDSYLAEIEVTETEGCASPDMTDTRWACY